MNNSTYCRVIDEKNICKELRRLGLLSFFNSLRDDEKIEFVISNASYGIIDWHIKIRCKYKKNVLLFSKGVELVENEFGVCQQTLGDVFRLTQKPDQNVLDFIKEVHYKATELNFTSKDSLDILLNGMKEGCEDIKMILLKAGSIDNVDMGLVTRSEEVIEERKGRRDDINKLFKKLEELKLEKNEPSRCNFCLKYGHIEKYCRCKMFRNSDSKGKKTINEVSQKAEEKLEELINKESLVYTDKKPFKAVFDTGSRFNFVSRRVLEKLDIKSRSNYKKLKFYTCLNEPFYVKEHVFIEVSYREKINRIKFFVLPKVKEEKLLIGKESLENVLEIQEKSYECEINTEKGKKIVKRIYPIPKKLEDEIQLAIKKLIENKYIRRSKSTWLNNIRPVIKPNGKIRITTNLVALNKIIDIQQLAAEY